MGKPKIVSEAPLWSTFEWTLYQEWAEDLGFTFEDVQRMAGVKPAADGARSSAWRAEHGGAPRVRRMIYDQLVKLEKAAPSPSTMGKIALGVEEWITIGQQLAMHAGGFVFLRQLQEARQALANATGRAVVGAVPADKKSTPIKPQTTPAPTAAAGGRKHR